jgi:ribosomal protein L11 methyltransferase
VSLTRIAVRAVGDGVEPLRARLLELVPSGLEERALGAEVELAAYVPETEVDALLGAFPDATTEPVADGWEDAWRVFHRPVVVDGLWLGPPWEQPPDPSRSVVIDPGRAFGTGAHPTTQLCVELLARTTSRGSLLDVGCGSGVLSIAAARLGFEPVRAVDVDPVAVETTRANAEANHVAVEASVLDALADTLPPAELAVANVLLRPVEEILVRLESREAITSGYLAGERPAHPGWSHVDALERDGWAADRFRRAVTAGRR